MNLGSFGKEIKSRPSFPPLLPVLGIVLVLGLAIVLWLGVELTKPQVTVDGNTSHLGLADKELSIAAGDGGSGLRSVSLSINQDGKELKLLEKSFPRAAYFSGAGPKQFVEKVELGAKALGLKDGSATMVVRVADYSWWNFLRGNVTELTFPLVVDSKPPVLSLLEAPQYIKAGGAGVVAYRISEPAGRHGVQINDIFYPGVPLPKKGEGVYGASIGLPFDLAAFSQSLVVAEDQAGNEAKISLVMRLHPLKIKSDKIGVGDAFLSAKLPEFATHYPELSGEPIAQFLKVNGEIRQANYEKIKEISTKITPERLWDGRFVRMEGSPKAGFADHRTYAYGGKEVDRQVHLGVDIASVRQAPVPAANRGRVVFAEYLGIYGNTVILDHGQGIFSLYSHLSRIDAQVGAILGKGATIGLSGLTGMAGGDHLHFSMLVNGIFVDPLEWWDEEWLKLHMLSVL